jgi:hypothetical protein
MMDIPIWKIYSIRSKSKLVIISKNGRDPIIFNST